MTDADTLGPAAWRLEFDSSRNRLHGRERARGVDYGLVFGVGRRRRWRPSDLVRALDEIMSRREAEIGLGPVTQISVKPHSIFNSRIFARWCQRKGITIAHREVDYFFLRRPTSDRTDTDSD